VRTISGLPRGFSTCCLRFTNGVATIHAKLASGWLAGLYREGGHEVLHTRRQKQLIDIPGAKVLAHSPSLNQTRWDLTSDYSDGGAVGELVGIDGGVVSGVINLESSGVEASDWRPCHDQRYHEA
jgi:hypothetical protein